MVGAGNKSMLGAIGTGILVLALFRIAQPIFAPLFFSLLIIALMWPCQLALQQKLPRLAALFITLSLTMTAILALGSSVAWGLTQLGHWLFLNAERLQAVYTVWADWLEQHGIPVMGTLSDRFDVRWLVSFMQSMAGRLNSFAGFAVLVLIFAMLGLLEVNEFGTRLAAPQAQPYGNRILAANRTIAAKLRRFMIVRTVASVLTGLVVWVFTLGMGLELAAAWGAIAFALNYIPFIGPFVATVLPTLFAIAHFGSWQMAIVIFACLNIIQFVIGSYLEPRLAGASLALSPFAVIFAVFFWSFMWGVSGAFIGVPVLIAFVVYCEGSSTAGWLAAILANKPPEPPDA